MYLIDLQLCHIILQNDFKKSQFIPLSSFGDPQKDATPSLRTAVLISTSVRLAFMC
jgi:hypothetical protein